MEFKTKQASLPKLNTTETHERRDSLSSSRTGDSGYVSDPDISLSPLELWQDKGPTLPFFQHPLPIPNFEHVDFEASTCAKTARAPKGAYAILIKRRGEGRKVAGVNRPKITSNPGCSLPVQSAEKPDWTRAFKNPSEALSYRDKVKTSRKEDVELWIDESIPSHNRPKERVSSIVSLSSTSSADMYSVTEDDEDDEVSEMYPNIFSKATLKTIDLIMRKIEVNLGYAAYIQCAGGHSSRGQGGTGQTSHSSGRAAGQGSGAKRKSRADEYNPLEPNDEDGPTKRRRVSIATTEDSEVGPRFACPFFKHDPNRYRNRRTCPGPGWPTVHRMKEHLYRAHAQPIFCPRCYTMFDLDNEFRAHLRSNPCQISAPQPIDGIDRETLMGLRKRGPALRLEEDKWRDTYRLLFPGVEDGDIPSPYYDSNSPSEESRRFRRELLERIRRELFATAEHETGPVEQNLLRQVADIIQRCESDLLSSFNTAPALNPPQFQQSVPTTRHPTPVSSSSISRRGSAQHTARAPAPPPTSTSPHRNANMPIAPPSYFVHEPLLPSVQYPPADLHDIPQTPSSEWIDWNAVFPPGPDRGEGVPHLATPVWT